MEFVAGMEQSTSGLPREGPVWLPQLLRTEFFGHCKKHQTGKHEKNQFCLSCCSGPYCPEGLHQLHPGHASVQVRKASHRDVVRIADIQNYLDVANIQAYTINSAKIVFLQSRPQPKLCKGAPKYCDTCHRSLADQVKFCSINCKLVAIYGNHDRDPALTLSPSSDSWSVLGFSGRANSGDGHSHLAPSVSDGHDGVVDSVNHDTSTSAFMSPSTPKKQSKRASLGLEPPPSKRRKNSDDGACPLSPMSVLGSGTAFAHDWLHGPSTPDSHEEHSPRMHPRKQFHPARAPFY